MENKVTQRLKEAICNAQISFVELEKKTGIPKSNLQRYANGTTQKIPIDAITSIAKAVNVDAAWILGWEKEEAPTSESVLTDYELEVIKLLRTVPEDKREDFLNYLQAAVNMLK